MNYKALITRLQIQTPLPTPVAVYPEKIGTYVGSRYYCAAKDDAKIGVLMQYLPVLDRWKKMAIKYRSNTELINLANNICQGKITKYQKIKAIHDWVFANIDYHRTDDVIPPDRLIEIRMGDCKSFTVLISTLLGIKGIPTWFKLVQIYDNIPRHIYNIALASWYPVDGTGYFAFEEIKRVIGYMLFEVDKTPDFPPTPAPASTGSEEYPPPVMPKLTEELTPFVLLGILYLIQRRRR